MGTLYFLTKNSDSGKKKCRILSWVFDSVFKSVSNVDFKCAGHLKIDQNRQFGQISKGILEVRELLKCSRLNSSLYRVRERYLLRKSMLICEKLPPPPSRICNFEISSGFI